MLHVAFSGQYVYYYSMECVECSMPVALCELGPSLSLTHTHTHTKHKHTQTQQQLHTHTHTHTNTIRFNRIHRCRPSACVHSQRKQKGMSEPEIHILVQHKQYGDIPSQ